MLLRLGVAALQALDADTFSRTTACPGCDSVKRGLLLPYKTINPKLVETLVRPIEA